MHFSLLVVGDNVEEKLEPYNYENDENQEFEMEYTAESAQKIYDKLDPKEKNIYATIEDYFLNCEGMVQDEYTGDFGFMNNPNSLYDWYEIGGRWSGLFLGKDGNYHDSLLKKDLDLEKMMDNHESKLKEEFFNNFIKNEPEKLLDIEYFTNSMNSHIQYKKYDFLCICHVIDKENYLLKDLPCSEIYDIINNCDPEDLLTIVDCHY